MVTHKVDAHTTLVFIMKILIFLSYKNKGDAICPFLPPPQLSSVGALVLFVLLHMFLVPAWVLHETTQHGSFYMFF